MFGLSFSSCQLIQGPAVRTWNCVAHFANLIWYKFNHVREPIMPRSRRRHHSRSRTRSRSHSYDRDRDPKRRKIESYESPQHKRSLSTESNEKIEEQVKIIRNEKDASISKLETIDLDSDTDSTDSSENKESPKSSAPPQSSHTDGAKDLNTSTADSETDDSDVETPNTNSDANVSQDSSKNGDDEESKTKKKLPTSKVSDSTITPKKTLSPNQMKKRLESEKRREEKLNEREKKKQEIIKMKEEKQKLREEKEQQKLKEKQEKQEQKQKEIEEKQKEKEMKDEKKKKEREEKEQKRKEKDEQKRKELEEKNKEKLKLEEKKQKAAAAFVNFFTKKSENSLDEKKLEETSSSNFMPFEVKSDMRLAPILRKHLTDDQKQDLIIALQNQTGKVYLEELKAGKAVGKSTKTWLPEDSNNQDDVIIVEDANLGESIEEQSKPTDKMRAKFLKFTDNRRPAYFGTWRKKSKFVKPRKPLALDKDHFDYEIDSDEDWEEGEDTGESLRGSDDEDKENESENEYEVDNDFFVPHGHLSDDEVNDEEDAVVSPEAHKAKLKLLKTEFEEEMKGKTQKIKPRVIGCIWYSKDLSNVDSAIHEFLKPLAIISNGPVTIKKRSKFIVQTPLRKSFQPRKLLDVELIPDFLKLIHGNIKNRKAVVIEFLNHLNEKNVNVDVSKTSLSKQVKKFAEWMRCPENGPLPNKFCWVVHNDVQKEYKVDLSLGNN